MAAAKKPISTPAEERTFDDADALAKNDSDAPPSAPVAETEPPPPPAPPSPVAPIPSRAEKKAAAPPVTTATYRVWAHGTLQRNGKTYQPGATLVLPIEIGDAIVCLSRVVADDDT